MPQWIEWIGLSQGAATPPLGSAVPDWLALLIPSASQHLLIDLCLLGPLGRDTVAALIKDLYLAETAVPNLPTLLSMQAPCILHPKCVCYQNCLGLKTALSQGA